MSRVRRRSGALADCDWRAALHTEASGRALLGARHLEDPEGVDEGEVLAWTCLGVGGAYGHNLAGDDHLGLRELAKQRFLHVGDQVAEVVGGDHRAPDLAAHYLGALCANIVLLVSPDRIVLSGGVMKRATLFPKVRAAMQRNLNGYLQLPQLTTQAGVDAYVGPSAWGNNAGLVGALTLAKEALAQARPARRRVESLLGAEIVAPAPSWGAAAAAACAGVAVGWLAARRR